MLYADTCYRGIPISPITHGKHSYTPIGDIGMTLGNHRFHPWMFFLTPLAAIGTTLGIRTLLVIVFHYLLVQQLQSIFHGRIYAYGRRRACLDIVHHGIVESSLSLHGNYSEEQGEKDENSFHSLRVLCIFKNLYHHKLCTIVSL